MILVPNMKKIATAAVSAIMAVSMLCSSAFADQPYEGYSYDWWGDPVPSQTGYVVDRVVTGLDFGSGTRYNTDAQLKAISEQTGSEVTKNVEIGELKEPQDLFIDRETQSLYIVDSGNHRILVTDVTYSRAFTVMDYFYNPKTDKYETLKNPHGIFVRHVEDAANENESTMIYIADYDNSRVIGVYADGTVFQIFERPSAEFYDADVTFLPNKVVVDVAGNVYVNIKSITDGAVMFAPDGSFSNFFGANRVEQTAQAIANKFWRTILSREAAASFIQAVPMEFDNFDIDDEGFIYTVTGSKSATTDIFKKMNPAGENILINLGYSDYTYGNMASYYYKNQTYGSQITDVDVDEYGTIRLLDFANGRIFEYTNECDLLFIYGGKGNQKGLFTNVTAVEAYNSVVYVLDSRKNSITTFKRTEFGNIVHEAMDLYNLGKYEEASGPWQEVLIRDSNYWFAYIGLGNSELSQGNYEQAMKYFYRNSRAGYNRAFKQYRMQFIRDNFNIFMIIVLVIIVALVVLSKVRKRIKAKKAGGK